MSEQRWGDGSGGGANQLGSHHESEPARRTRPLTLARESACHRPRDVNRIVVVILGGELLNGDFVVALGRGAVLILVMAVVVMLPAVVMMGVGARNGAMKVGSLGMLGWLIDTCPGVRMGKAHPLEEEHRDQEKRDSTTAHDSLVCRQLIHIECTKKRSRVNVASLPLLIASALGITGIAELIRRTSQ